MIFHLTYGFPVLYPGHGPGGGVRSDGGGRLGPLLVLVQDGNLRVLVGATKNDFPLDLWQGMGH